MPIQNKLPKTSSIARTSADVIHYGKVFRPYGREWVENGLITHVPIPTIIELIHQNIPAKRNTDLTSLKKTALVSILMKFYDKTNNTGKKRIEQWVYTHRYRRKIQFDNPFVEKINKFLNHLKTFESPKFTVTPATASKIFNELTITGITSLSEVRSVLKSNIVKSSTQEKAFNSIFNEWFSSDLSKYTSLSPSSRVKIIPESLSALDSNPLTSQSSQSSQSSNLESLLSEFRQIVSSAANSEGEYIPNEATSEHTESPETPQDPDYDPDDPDLDDLEEDEPPEPPEELEPKSDTSPSSPDSDKEDESNETSEEDESVSDSDSQSDLPEDLEEEPPEEDEKDEEPDSKSDSSENEEDPEPEEPEDDSGETSDSSEETKPEDEEPPEDETSKSDSETDEEKDESEENSSDEKEENNDGEDESDEESDEEPQQDGDSDSTTEPLRERPLVKEQVKDMILKIANSEDSTIDELRHHTKEQLNIT